MIGRMSDSRRVVLLGFDGVQSLDLVGPLEVFSTAARLGVGAYETEVVAPAGSPLPARAACASRPTVRLRACRGPIDTLLVAGGQGVRAAAGDERLVRWLRGAAERSRRVASVCTGAFLLAQAGLLDGRRATTHWASAEQLAREHPAVRGRARPHLRARRRGVDLRRRDGRDGPGPGAGGSRPRSRGVAGGGALAGALRAAAGRAVAVQRPAGRPGGRARAAARGPGARAGRSARGPAPWRRWPPRLA